MELTHIRRFYNQHCRFKLRSGKEVFGVVWEVDHGGSTRQFFASVRDYERFQSDPGQPLEVVPLQPDEIMAAESIAS